MCGVQAVNVYAVILNLSVTRGYCLTDFRSSGAKFVTKYFRLSNCAIHVPNILHSSNHRKAS